MQFAEASHYRKPGVCGLWTIHSDKASQAWMCWQRDPGRGAESDGSIQGIHETFDSIEYILFFSFLSSPFPHLSRSRKMCTDVAPKDGLVTKVTDENSASVDATSRRHVNARGPFGRAPIGR